MTVAALYVEAGGAYYGLPDVDPWDEARDARLYAGPWPVVAHPPCARWSRLAGFTEARFGLKRGDDGGCFAAALAAVRRFGGVLEHPAHTVAFRHFGLPIPKSSVGWTHAFGDDGASCYVEQGRYGYPVKKATWLYAFGVELPSLRWGLLPDALGNAGSNDGGHGGMDAWRDRFTGSGGSEATSADGIGGFFKGHRHDGLRSATPPEFRDALLAMARGARAEAAA